MDWLSTHDLRQLSESEGPYHVSLYMPTHRAGPDTRQDPIRLKNLLTSAEEQLIDQGMRPTLARDMLQPGSELVEDYEFWQQQSDALTVFATPNSFRYFRLPLQVPELAVATDRFHLKPLLPLFSEDGLFFVLALSMNEVRVLRCTRFSEQELKVEGVPRNMAAALWPDDPEKQLQWRTIPGTAPRGAAIYHGAGGSERDLKNDLLRYFQRIDRGLQNLLHDQHAPLVLAGVEYLHAIYREANTYRYLFDQGIDGNPDEERSDALRQKAWQIVEPYFDQAKQVAIARYEQLIGTGKASSSVREVARAAREGRVDTLFVANGVQRWGRPAADGVSFELHEEREPGDQDLLDFAAVQTLLNSGAVFAVPPESVPGNSAVAAIFRY